MTDSEYLGLIQAEIDGELDARQRGELARRLLADPDARGLRDEFQRLCARLDAVKPVEPPPQLLPRIMEALPPATLRLPASRWQASRWRYAALLAGVLAAAAFVFKTVNGPGPASNELTGTMASARGRTTLDTVRLGTGPVAGRVDLYRDATGLGLTFDLAASAPVEVVVSSAAGTLRVTGPTSGDRSGLSTSVSLPGAEGSRRVDLTFLMSGREVGHARLSPAEGH
jgi:anti-sigma factor RsiW